MRVLHRKRNRPRREPSRIKLPRVDFARAASMLALAGGLIVVAWGFATALDRPVGQVSVDGPFQRVSPQQVEVAVETFAKSGFLSIDLDAVRAAIEAVPWVDRARVERSWPDGLHVVVTEQVPAARWCEDGLLNTRGELFLTRVRHVPPELPRLEGPEGTEREVAKLYLETYPKLLGVGMRLARVRLDPRGAWQLELASGVDVRIGRQDVTERLERFIRVAGPLIASRPGDIAYVDMRYSNGFAVGWNSRVAKAGDRTKVEI
jgi:cell division protein FtsQ